MDSKAVFGNNLRRIRQSRQMSQEKLAAKVDLHRTYISSIERGERNVSLENIVKLAWALEVPPSELLEGINLTSPNPND